MAAILATEAALACKLSNDEAPKAKQDDLKAKQDDLKAAQAPACMLALVERLLQSPMGAMHCDKAGFVPLSAMLTGSPTLKRLAQDSTSALAAAIASSPSDGAVELDEKQEAVRCRGQLERVRLAAERHVLATGIVSLPSLLCAWPVAAKLSGLPEAERMHVLQHALRGSTAVTACGVWVAPADPLQLASLKSVPASGPAASVLSPNASVFQPSWERKEAKGAYMQMKIFDCDAKVSTPPSSVACSGRGSGQEVGTSQRSTLSEPDSEPEALGSPNESCPPEDITVPGQQCEQDQVPPFPSGSCSAPPTPTRAPEALVSEAPVSPESKSEVSDPAANATATPTSWAAQMRLRRLAASQAGDDVARSVKSILNKLTIEKFAQLSEKLLTIEFRTKDHMEMLIQEVFQKATMQHHFIDMYADLCMTLHEFFTSHPVGDDAKFTFKRALLNQCQAAFERNLAPPKSLADLEDPEERIIEETKYKTRMVGNIRLVGALLVRKLIPTKVMFAIIDELLSEPTAEALEAAAVLLTAVGPTFDSPESTLRPVFTGLFSRVKQLVASDECEPRARCLLKDVLELRAGDWSSKRPKRQERPTTLQAVAERAAAEGASASAVVRPRF